MPFASDKAALITLVEEIRCDDAPELQPPSNYAELFDTILHNLGLYNCDPNVIISMLGVFDDATLVANGIYLAKIGSTVTNPVAIVNSTYNDVNIDAGGIFTAVQIISHSKVSRVTISNNTTGVGVIVSGGATVGELEVEAGSCIDTLLVKSCGGANISTLNKVITGACIEDISVDDTAKFGGYCSYINLAGEDEISDTDIVIDRGDTVRFRFWSNQAKTSPINISTSTFELEVSDPDGIIWTFTSLNGLSMPGPESNILELVDGTTAIELPQGIYTYELKRTFEGDTKVKMQGSFKITDPGV